MSMKALANIYTVTPSVPPIAVTSTKTGTAIDLANCIENVVLFNFGLWTDGTHTPSLTYSGTAGGAGTYTACAAADIVGTASAVSSTATAAAAQKLSYIGPYRYIKPLITVAGATTGAVASVQGITKLRVQNSST